MGRRSNNKNTKGPRQPGERRISVNEEDQLLSFLLKALVNEHSKTAVKSLLSKGHVSVNGEPTTQFDTPLKSGDLVTVSYGRAKVVFNHPMLKIVWEDDSLLVVNKKQGLLSVANPKVKEKTAYHLLSDYLKREDARSKLFILHRLERDVSGLMVFAKNKAVQAELHTNWNMAITNRRLIAVVEGVPEKETGLLTSFERREHDASVFITSADSGTESIVRYQRLRTNSRYTLLDLAVESGHKNLIREQMQALGTPIAGDLRYGAETDPIERVSLHAYKLFFVHPVTHEELRFETPIPSNFIALVK